MESWNGSQSNLLRKYLLITFFQRLKLLIRKMITSELHSSFEDLTEKDLEDVYLLGGSRLM